jgi:TPP-dependent pyruvate/acetoin dehydrogenase alpha subunit
MRYSKELLKKLYQTMIRIRNCEESLVEPILNGEARCPVHLYSGEEAIATGVCAVLDKEDYIFSTHRSHGHYLAKGGYMAALIAEIYGKEDGCSRGRGGSMHLIAPDKGMMGSVPIVAGTISLAVGAALASSIRKDKRITVSFFGDGATGEGVLYESLNFASLKKLPIIFACENNFYSTHLHIKECRINDSIYKIGIPFCIESFRVDGNDVLKVYEAAKEAVNKCRRGQGPIFIEFITYRQRGHVGPDDNIQGAHTDIRPQEEVTKWLKKDPIQRFESYLIKNKIMKKEEMEIIQRQAEKEVLEAHVIAQKAPYPKKGELTKYVFEE